MHDIRGRDSFDIGEYTEVVEPQQDMITDLVSNPQKLIETLHLTQKQAANIRSLIVGGGSAAVHKWLHQYFGDEIAGAIGGFISGFVAKKMLGER